MTSPDELVRRLRVEASIWQRAREAALFDGTPMPSTPLVRDALNDAFRAPVWRVNVRPEPLIVWYKELEDLIGGLVPALMPTRHFAKQHLRGRAIWREK